MRRWVAVLILSACSGGAAATSSIESSTLTSVSSTSTITTLAPTTSAAAPATTTTTGLPVVTELVEFPVQSGSRPHDVAPAADGSVWYSGQGNGTLGRLDPQSGQATEIALGPGSAPHGVIVGPDGMPWLTDSGLNALVRVDPDAAEVTLFELPGANVNLNTAVFDLDGILWFTGQSGAYGSLDPTTGELVVYEAPGGRGPYGITVTPSNVVFYASLAGSHIARINPDDGTATILTPPTAQQGSRRVWSDSDGTVWVSQWEAGQVAAYEPASGTWREWTLPGDSPSAYAVYVDETDAVWLTDFTGNGALVRFDPDTELFESFPLPTPGGNVRQLLGRPGEVWGAESAADALVVVRFAG
jgi:virginiamycin B lyase